ncbi:MAG: aminofutalosine synthase MqnE, partial [Firmicutes bacterium]|nr:aminofutalosine synthase MqnE [Bacillota bacterium]
MLELSVRSELEPIAEKVKTGERLSREDGIVLMRTSDLLGLGALADQVRRRKVGDYVYFINNAHINYSNVCTSLCRLCAFGKAEGDQGAYLMSLDEIEERATGFAAYGITELHIVGGLHPRLPLSYYEEMLRRSAAALPGVHIQAFTA